MRLGKVLALVVAEGDAADVLRVLVKPLGDLDVWHPVAHLLIDGLDEWRSADVATSEDWG